MDVSTMIAVVQAGSLRERKRGAADPAARAKRSAATTGDKERVPVPSDPAQFLVLARALLHAARLNRAFDRRAQDVVLRRLGDLLPDRRASMRAAFIDPPDMAEHTRGVPPELAQQVYAVSVIALGGDADAQGRYLQSLARHLKLSAVICERIQERLPPDAQAD